MFFLRDSAKAYGKLRGHVAYCDGNLRRVKALQMIGKDGSLGDREAQAYASDDYGRALQDLENSTAEMETLRAQREAAVYLIDTWRSLSSAQKQGIQLG